MRTLFPSTLDVLEKNLELRQQRHRVLASNVANAETPGFIAKEVYFEDALRQAAKPSSQSALYKTHPDHLPGPVPSVHQVKGVIGIPPSDDVGNDLNTVSIDQQMAKLTMNTFQFNASTEILSRMLAQIKRVITDGGR
jgi:flagellar basal-body rod protein FlgB